MVNLLAAHAKHHILFFVVEGMLDDAGPDLPFVRFYISLSEKTLRSETKQFSILFFKTSMSWGHA